jgi:hypothetical protein
LQNILTSPDSPLRTEVRLQDNRDVPPNIAVPLKKPEYAWREVLSVMWVLELQASPSPPVVFSNLPPLLAYVSQSEGPVADEENG